MSLPSFWMSMMNLIHNSGPKTYHKIRRAKYSVQQNSGECTNIQHSFCIYNTYFTSRSHDVCKASTCIMSFQIQQTYTHFFSAL